MLKSCMRLLYAAILLCGQVSCMSTDPPGMQMRGDDNAVAMREHRLLQICSAVLPYWDGQKTASVIQLAPDRGITARHVVPEFALMRELEVDGRIYRNARPTFNAWIGSTFEKIFVPLSGETAAAQDDFAVLQLSTSAAMAVSVPFDAGHTFVEGEEVILIGYPDLDPTTYDPCAPASPPTIVRTTVSKPPLPWLALPPELICVEAPQRALYAGLSGGAALVWDESRSDYTVVGIYRGQREWKAFGVSLSAHTILRIPEETLSPPCDDES